ncbi:hypothetical protein CEUSTIGMA_g10564.t1 [Chlamydomonas eustigma]|uniref:Uncharacterized protein n=1 Tax=Chlamydomonas eustigma TaxID=1157962 RepID=A0A250XJ89_9CHLO|nr:hypothetical protein CEUSTIGMA_g10564.t1 [Chlamydomonas eustigma]|eukprot:GAX83138.1 hypothetical protein CEUSTIGMA_g10564.t1 [Chlamydomonas eustigma]
MEEDEALVIRVSAAGSSPLLQKTLPLQGTEEAGKNRNKSPSRPSFCVMPKQRYKLGRRGGSLANLMHLLKTNTGDLSVEEYHASRPARRGSTLGLGSPFGSTAAVNPAVVSPATSSHNSSNNNVTDEVSAGGSTACTAVGSGIKSTTAPYGKLVSRQLLIYSTATSQDVCKDSHQHVNRKGNLLARQPGALEQAGMMESRVNGDMTRSSGSTAEGVITRGAAPSSEAWSPGITRPYVAENVPPLRPNKSTSVYQKTGGSSTIAMRRTWLEEASADERRFSRVSWVSTFNGSDEDAFCRTCRHNCGLEFEDHKWLIIFKFVTNRIVIRLNKVNC